MVKVLELFPSHDHRPSLSQHFPTDLVPANNSNTFTIIYITYILFLPKNLISPV